MLGNIAEIMTVPLEEEEKIDILPQFINEFTQNKQYSFEGSLKSRR